VTYCCRKTAVRQQGLPVSKRGSITSWLTVARVSREKASRPDFGLLTCRCSSSSSSQIRTHPIENMNHPGPPGLKYPVQTSLRNPIIRRAAICKERYHRWRKHIYLGRKSAFNWASCFYGTWILSLGFILGGLSVVWGQLSPRQEDSLLSCVARATFVVDYLLISIALLGIWPSNALYTPDSDLDLLQFVVNHRWSPRWLFHLHTVSSHNIRRPRNTEFLCTDHFKGLFLWVHQFHSLLSAIWLKYHLEMATESTVEDVLLCLRVRHLIPDLMRVTHHMIFPAHKFASLSPTDKLRDIGVQDLSVLYVRTSILGGSPESDSDSGLCLYRLFMLNELFVRA
jgi:hypothetical protein